ncbi:MAG: AMP phosphorylase [Candidatus Aenigmatarchaeota archaeon]
MEIKGEIMKLVAKRLDMDAGGKLVAVMNKNDAEELGIKPLNRIFVRFKKKIITCIVNISENFVKEGEILLYNEAWNILGLKNFDIVEIEKRPELISKTFIRKKINGKRISEEEIKEIVKDVVNNNLNDLELAAFITALQIHGLSLDEEVAFVKAMTEVGKRLELKRKKIVCDKHSLGGVPGDKTTILLVPIIASLGLTIPKTSSRAITSAAGTADRMECLAPVNLSLEEMKRVVEKTNGCIVWGGSVDISPADDLFIRIEQPLNLDPLYIPSILSKKKAVGATHLVIDLPTGRGTKIKTFGEAFDVASEFIKVSKKLGINAACAVTFGEQPVGYTIGPALEAREALEALITRKEPEDLIDKACSLAGILLEMIGKGNKNLALKAIKSGKAEKKIREIIEEQGGKRNISPEDIKIGEKQVNIFSRKNGIVMWIKNNELAELAKIAGAPKDRGAGIKLHVKIGDRVKENDKLFTIYAEKSIKLQEAEKYAKEIEPIVVVEDLKKNMLIKIIKEEGFERSFILER